LLGFFVHHSNLKLGKIRKADQRSLTVLFYADNAEGVFERDAFDDKVLQRTVLPLGTRCQLGEGFCCVEAYEGTIEPSRPALYRVKTDDELSRLVTEVELIPIGVVREDPISSLAALHAEGYALFAARTQLLDAVGEVTRQGGGLQALLSSRIDVRSHQAYVASVVLGDRVRRYILADEVGLGKTIEAGVVVHHLLSTNPAARVLVLCPGALTQQWLCEFYSKFSSQVFTLLELYAAPTDLPAERRKRVIAPLHTISGCHGGWVRQSQWDLVVVDEVHHLLAVPDYYTFVREISARAPALLLLSALPAQQRKTEFLSLLSLLEPERYDGTPPEDFTRLFDAQADIGRQLRRLRRRLEEADPEEIREVAEDLVGLPALAGDTVLAARGAALVAAPERRVELGWEFLREAAARARINRRLLRNRRARLVEEGLVERTARRLILAPYDPGQPELDAIDRVLRLVRALAGRLAPEAWSATARLLMQSLAHPQTAFETLTRLARLSPTAVPPPHTLGHLAGAGGWPAYRDALLGAARQHLRAAAIEEALNAVRLWRDAESGLARVTLLADELERLERTYKKIVVFAGFPGLLEHLEPYLIEQFEPESVTVFRSDMERAEKEANVDRFRTDPDAWLLLSDESGGEGRNFQFATAVLHYDTPWYVSRVEQRIGRLDRLGRHVVDVPSCVLVGRGTPDEDLVRCFSEAFCVYSQSVSGLEFALRDLEAELVRVLVGCEGPALDEYLPALQERVKQERGREEAEAVLDEASFSRDAAARYRRGEDLTEAETELESAFIEFLRKAGSGNAARQYRDEEFPGAVWELDSAQLQHIKLADQPANQPESVTRYRGTFRRAVAQVRQDLQFFSFGHPFFDEVLESCRNQQCGRVYALDLDAPGEALWQGFEFVLVAEPDKLALKGVGGLAWRAEKLFAVPPLHLFVDGDAKVLPEPGRLLELRKGLSSAGKDRTWWNLTKEKAPRASAAFPGRAWRTVAFSAAAAASAEARRRFEERIAHDVTNELSRLSDEAGTTRDAAEARALQSVARAVQNWTVRVDAAGFLSVNGRLGRAK
jgi:ATP-dependent helicase HepA